MTTTADPAVNGQREAPKGYKDFESMNFMGRIERPKAPPGESGSGSSYSDFPHKQAALANTIRGVVLRGGAQDEKSKLLHLRLLRIFEKDWTSECTNRDAHIKRADAWAESWAKKMRAEPVPEKDENGTPIPTVDDLLRQWNTSAAFLAEAYVQKKLHGLPHVRETLREEVNGTMVTAREKLDLARKQMEEVRFKAATLPPAHNQYFWSRILALRISIDRNVDLALGIPVVDFTEVKQKIAEGIDIDLVIDEMPWAYRELEDRVFNSLDGDLMREYLAILQIQQWPYDRRPPKPKKRGMFGLGRGDDEDEAPDEEEEEYDERGPKRRNNDRKKDRKRTQNRRR